MSLFEKRLAAAEAKAGAASGSFVRLFIQPTECRDVAAWERACEAEAARDGVQPLMVRFVKPSDIAPAGPLH